ncbi:MAG TPA: tRNA dimethylallyltransferase, partial [Anaerolineales bacterium]|nr:tRNA dimethylallyltransferase [Anaerolineales bacterium]
LYARIDARIDAMFEEGLLAEVGRLVAAGHGTELPALSAIGYRECMRVLRGEWTVDKAKMEMRRATRAYVRRQANWFKETDPAIQWFDAGGDGAAAVIAASIRNTLHEGKV